MNKLIILLISVLCTGTAYGTNYSEEPPHQCVLKEVIKQYPQYKFEDQLPMYGGSFISDDKNWDMIFSTRFEDGGYGRFFVSLENGEAHIIIPGISPLDLDLGNCL